LEAIQTCPSEERGELTVGKKKSHLKKELRYIAYHEAGHAVTAWYCGYGVHRASIEPDSDEGIAGRISHDRDGGELGDLGVRFWDDPTHGLVVQEQDGSFRLPSPEERQHNQLTDELVEMGAKQRLLLICAAGEAAGFAFVPEYVGRAGSEGDQADAQECDPNMNWEEWVARAREFLLRPAVHRRVEALAMALLSRGTIECQDVLQIICRAM
jgi:hypothetical protein